MLANSLSFHILVFSSISGIVAPSNWQVFLVNSFASIPLVEVLRSTASPLCNKETFTSQMLTESSIWSILWWIITVLRSTCWICSIVSYPKILNSRSKASFSCLYLQCRSSIFCARSPLVGWVWVHAVQARHVCAACHGPFMRVTVARSSLIHQTLPRKPRGNLELLRFYSMTSFLSPSALRLLLQVVPERNCPMQHPSWLDIDLQQAFWGTLLHIF